MAHCRPSAPPLTFGSTLHEASLWTILPLGSQQRQVRGREEDEVYGESLKIQATPHTRALGEDVFCLCFGFGFLFVCFCFARRVTESEPPHTHPPLSSGTLSRPEVSRLYSCFYPGQDVPVRKTDLCSKHSAPGRLSHLSVGLEVLELNFPCL